MIERRKTRQLHVGSVAVGGDAPIAVQSMTNTHTDDAAATLEQIQRLADAGCDIIRCAVPDMAAAEGLKTICKESPVPVIADIHFDYKLALAAIEAGVDGLRLNPGNIGGEEKVRAVVEAAKERNIPIRIGVNGRLSAEGFAGKIRPSHRGGSCGGGLAPRAHSRSDGLP